MLAHAENKTSRAVLPFLLTRDEFQRNTERSAMLRANVYIKALMACFLFLLSAFSFPIFFASRSHLSCRIFVLLQTTLSALPTSALARSNMMTVRLLYPVGARIDFAIRRLCCEQGSGMGELSFMAFRQSYKLHSQFFTIAFGISMVLHIGQAIRFRVCAHLFNLPLLIRCSRLGVCCGLRLLAVLPKCWAGLPDWQVL